MNTNSSTLTRHPNTVLFSAADSSLGFGKLPEHRWEKGPNGNDILVLPRVPVFRSGEFADSMGREHLWEDMHIQTMASNYNLLRDTGVFKDVPIRCDHPSFFDGGLLKDVIGYHGDVVTEKRISKVDGKEYTYFLADLHIIREDAQQNILNGLWRNRSSEVGNYVTNNKAEHWPAYMGVAYVDIPAVEGLDQFAKKHQTSDYTFLTEEYMDPNKGTVNPQPAPQPEIKPSFSFSLAGTQGGAATTTDFAKVQEHINAQYARITELTGQVAERDTRIQTLEAFQKETVEGARVDFAKGLVKEGKVLGTEEETLVEFCKGLSDEAFAQYSKMMSTAPAAPILGNYGNFSAAAPAAPGTQQASADQQKSDRISVLREQVQMHARSGKPAEKIMEFGSYKELATLDASAAAAALKV
ncbi:gp010 [Rhodococcus phage ReqiDocB7]|uniref:head maturation protease n=1 Tax=Rhodococcus phage ReqiDocB7 TaxID=691966 RepID=UPI0001CDD74C|nr:head maturation protease [Rhodococcus phage ReqiDocB7]ADD80796.1 gp010 [Rhodococcus phage ReqiDocB7]